MKTYEEKFAKSIRKQITEKGLKQNAVAKKSGIPEDTFSKIVNMKRRIFADEAYRICITLNCTMEEMLEDAKQ